MADQPTDEATDDALDEPFDPDDALDDFLEELGEVSPLDARAMIAAWEEVDAGERTAAWALVREEVDATGRDDLLDAARQAVIRWSQESGHALEGSAYSVTQGEDLIRLESRLASARPVVDAAAATILRDVLPPDVYDVLYTPFAAATEDVEDDEIVEDEVVREEEGADDPSGGDDAPGSDERS